MSSSFPRLPRRLAALSALVLALAAMVVPATVHPANGLLVNCNVAGRMCIYLNITGNGSGTVTFKSFTLFGTKTTVSIGDCLRQGGTTSGACTLAINAPPNTSPSSVTVEEYIASLGGSCYRYDTAICITSGGSYSRSFTWAFSATDSGTEMDLLNPETMDVKLAGTGSGTVTSSPRGISCPGKCSADFADGTSVQLTATAAAGDTFAGFSDPLCSGTNGGNPCTWVMNMNRGITATFNAPATPPPPPTPSPTPHVTPKPSAGATATPTPHVTPSPVTHPTATPAHGATNPPGTTSAPSSAAASAAAGPSAGASEAAPAEASTAPGAASTEPGAGSAVAGASLAPLDTPPPELSNTAGPGSSALVIVPIAVGLLGVGGFLLFRGLRRRA
jgi:hypothetical protein